jgi:hypothetical protein
MKRIQMQGEDNFLFSTTSKLALEVVARRNIPAPTGYQVPVIQPIA